MPTFFHFRKNIFEYSYQSEFPDILVFPEIHMQGEAVNFQDWHNCAKNRKS